jgi:RHH-type rel operon transcriptional repressor/antitoxin RelB
MFAIRLEENLMLQLNILAKSKKVNRTSIVREAIMRFLEDNEDLDLALAAQKKMKSTKKLSQLRKELGLDN